MAEPPPASSGRADLVGRVLGYMDRPWKAIVVILLLILGGLGYAAWFERGRLIEAWAPPPSGLALKPAGDLVLAVVQLSRLDGVAVAMLWSIDIRENAARFIIGRNRDGTPWLPGDIDIPDRLPAITETSKLANVIAILAGDPRCEDPAGSSDLLFGALAINGVRQICMIPVPPTHGQVIALILLIWRAPPAPRVAAAAMEAATEIARKLIK